MYANIFSSYLLNVFINPTDTTDLISIFLLNLSDLISDFGVNNIPT